jgi:hypothetical protein
MEIECNNLHMFSCDKPCYARFIVTNLVSVHKVPIARLAKSPKQEFTHPK